MTLVKEKTRKTSTIMTLQMRFGLNLPNSSAIKKDKISSSKWFVMLITASLARRTPPPTKNCKDKGGRLRGDLIKPPTISTQLRYPFMKKKWHIQYCNVKTQCKICLIIDRTTIRTTIHRCGSNSRRFLKTRKDSHQIDFWLRETAQIQSL